MQSNRDFVGLIPEFEPSSSLSAFWTRHLRTPRPWTPDRTEERASDTLKNGSCSLTDTEPDDLVSRDRMSRNLISIDLIARTHSFWNICPAGTRLTRSTILGAFQYLSRNSSIRWNDARTIMSTDSDFAKHVESHLLRCIKEVLQIERGGSLSQTWVAKFNCIALSREAVGLMLMYVFVVMFLRCYMIINYFRYLAYLLTRLLWQLVVWIAFVCWLAFYRYPFFDILYPMVQARVSTNNVAVYRQLTGPAMIRIIRLKAGSSAEPIVCKLITGSLEDLEFEALSYVWGVDLFPSKIQVDSKPFYVTGNLHAALQELRLPEQDRSLWIDALCINQSDPREKNSQVQMMRSIYGRASTTRVYLGSATAETASVFALLAHWNMKTQRWREISEYHPPPAPERMTLVSAGALRELWLLIRHRLFVRARNKALRDNKLPLHRNGLRDEQYWFMLQEFWKMIDHEWWQRTWVIQEVVVSATVVLQRGKYTVAWDDFCKLLYGPNFRNHTAAVHFAKTLQNLRNHAQVSKRSESLSLLDLVYRFRFQCATLGLDKIYALQGLLPACHPSLLSPDYDRETEHIYMHFTVSSIAYNKNLTVLVYAAGAQMQGVSWCRDWRLRHDGPFEASLLANNTTPYRASGTQQPIYAIDFDDRVLSLQGYEVDKVATLYYGAKDPGRFLFETQAKRAGLGPRSMKKGDLVFILLGGCTPYILRLAHRGRGHGLDEEGNRPRVYYKLVGEANVEGLMYYEGSMENDIKIGKIVPEWIHLK